MDEPWEHYTKCNESDRQIPYDLFHMWNQKQNKTKLQAYRYRGKWGFVTEMRAGEWVKKGKRDKNRPSRWFYVQLGCLDYSELPSNSECLK